jgi:hypothetical protein
VAVVSKRKETTIYMNRNNTQDNTKTHNTQNRRQNIQNKLKMNNYENIKQLEHNIELKKQSK